jgi:hypothetical protein
MSRRSILPTSDGSIEDMNLKPGTRDNSSPPGRRR